MIRCADCKHFRYVEDGFAPGGCYCLAHGIIPVDEYLAYQYNFLMCDYYLPKDKESKLFEKEIK